MVSEVSDPRLRRITGPVGAVAREFFQFNDAVSPTASTVARSRPDEPYVYSGPVSGKASPAWIAAGAIGVAAIVVFAAMGSELSDSAKALKKSQQDVATANATIAGQLDKLASLEKQKATAQAVKDQDERDEKVRLDRVKDIATAALGDDVSQRNVVVTVDGKRVKLELSDRVMFEDKGVALTDAGRRTLAKVAAAAKKAEANVEVNASVDGRAPKAASKKDVLPDGSWAFASTRAALIARSIDEDGKLASSKIVAKGLGRQKNRRIEIDLIP